MRSQLTTSFTWACIHLVHMIIKQWHIKLIECRPAEYQHTSAMANTSQPQVLSALMTSTATRHRKYSILNIDYLTTLPVTITVRTIS